MEESSTYQWIKSKGRLEGVRQTLLELGEDKFGPPDVTVREKLDGVSDAARLSRMAKAILHVGSWQELLSSP